MRFSNRRIPAVLLLSTALGLAGCQSVEDRAESRYQNALALIEEGDVARAIVELRNVFELNANHREARFLMAELRLEQGNRGAAYREYLRLAEQDPEDLEIRITLSEMAFLGGNWEEFDRHGARIEELAPEDVRVQVVALTRDYRDANDAADESARRELGRRADALLETQPENPLLRNILVDHAMRAQDFDRALDEIDWLIAYDPRNGRNYQDRLRVLNALGDVAGIEAQLRDLVEIFPNNPDHMTTLIQFYISRGDLDAAEALLRKRAVEAGTDDPDPMLDVIRFLVELRGIDAARAEIETIIADYPDPVPFLTISAGLDFSEGKRDEAIATLEGVLDGAEPSERMRDIAVVLSRMLLATGDEAGARARVADVLAEQADHPGALKLEAAWQIEADDTDAAIRGLRVALNQDAEDIEALTLMANAYARTGQPDLTRDFLARAVQASGNAPTETLRFARILTADESYFAAEDVLIDALRRDRANFDLLDALATIYLSTGDLARAQAVADALERLGGDIPEQAANGIKAEILSRQQGTDAALAFLRTLAEAEDASLETRISLVRAQLAVGDPAAALNLAQELREEFPDVPALTLVLAVAHVANNEIDQAITLYEGFLDEIPARPDIWLELARLHQRQGDRDVAKAVIDEGLSHAPQAATLLWARASFFLQDGETDAAIDLYEQIYAQDSSSLVMANNLASLLTTYRDDEASLERAWAIARRLSGTENPSMQDTYGWILHRRGDSAAALPYLEAAAESLPNEALAQYHLGQAYLALERQADALAQFDKAVELAGPTDTRPQITEARTLIQSLREAAPAEN